MSSSTNTANMASTAKRSATAIQRLAKQLDGLDLAERNAIYAAAEILLKHGNRAKNKAMGEKRVEQIRERAQAKARAEARQIIATWPQATTIDRLSIIYATRDGVRRIEGRADQRDPAWELQYATREAIEDIVSDAVMHAVPYSSGTAAVPVADHLAQRRAFADQVRARPGIVALAAKWDERIGHQ